MRDDERLAMVRAAMPAVTSTVYLNTGTYGPLSHPASEAMAKRERRDLDQGRAGAPSLPEHAFIEALVRDDLASVLGCSAAELALTSGASDGMNYALWGVDWRPGDELLTTDVEHIGGIGPAYVLRDRFGVRLRLAACASAAQAVNAVRGGLSTKTRAVVLSHVAWGTGEALPVAEIAAVARRAGALTVVDGAQAAGAIAVDVTALGVDAYAVPGQKWLCGPGGTGALYLAAGALDRIRPSFAASGTFGQFDGLGRGEYHPDARRFELGFGHTPSLVGLHAVLRWILDDVGLAWALARTTALADYARARLATMPGVTVRTPAGALSGLTNFAFADREPAEVVEELFARKIVIRAVPSPAGLRVSTGFFNDEGDIDRLIAVLGVLGAGRD